MSVSSSTALDRQNDSEDLTKFIHQFSEINGLSLKPRGPDQSPSKHRSSENDSKSTDCVRCINHLWWQGRNELHEVVRVFQDEAVEIRKGWGFKSRADQDLLHTSRNAHPDLPIASSQRAELLSSLHNKLHSASEEVKARTSKKRVLKKSYSEGDTQPQRPYSKVPVESSKTKSPKSSTTKRQTKLSETWSIKPIPIDFRLTSKRLSDGIDDGKAFKKPYRPTMYMTEPCIETLPINTEDRTHLPPLNSPQSDDRNRTGPVDVKGKHPQAPSQLYTSITTSITTPGYSHLRSEQKRNPISANTSFDSNSSSVFSRGQSDKLIVSQSSFDANEGKLSAEGIQPNFSSSYDDRDAEDVMMDLDMPDVASEVIQSLNESKMETERFANTDHTREEESAIRKLLQPRLQSIFRK